MKPVKLLFIIAIATLIFSGCKKKEPEVINEDPVFSFTGNINGSALNYRSGTNNYYMFSSYLSNSDNVVEYISELKDKSCSGVCANSFKLRLKNYRPSNGALTKIDSSLQQRYYNYSSPIGTANTYSVTFVHQFIGGTAQNFTWTFDDGTTSTLASPTRIYDKPGKYAVCLKIESSNGCSSSVCGSVKIGQVGDFVESGFSSASSGNSISFTSLPVLGVAPYQYLWDFGDGMNSNEANPIHNYTIPGVYKVNLRVTDSKNNSDSFENNVNTQNPGATCMTRFSFVKKALINPLNLFNVAIEWTDSNGTVYTSENNGNPGSNGFKIISIEDYKINEKGNKTKKMKALLNCTLFNGSNSVLLKDAEIVFAIAYPN